jgi:hypothetical protein
MNTEEDADAVLLATYIFPKYVIKLSDKFYFHEVIGFGDKSLGVVGK